MFSVLLPILSQAAFKDSVKTVTEFPKDFQSRACSHTSLRYGIYIVQKRCCDSMVNKKRDRRSLVVEREMNTATNSYIWK